MGSYTSGEVFFWGSYFRRGALLGYVYQPRHSARIRISGEVFCQGSYITRGFLLGIVYQLAADTYQHISAHISKTAGTYVLIILRTAFRVFSQMRFSANERRLTQNLSTEVEVQNLRQLTQNLRQLTQNLGQLTQNLRRLTQTSTLKLRQRAFS